MRLFLIRHGESVDNVAGVLAGRRDSALTNHGAEQARRLSDYLTDNRPPLTRIFSSTLQRAYKTASIVAAKQSTKDLTISTVPYLIERDFGYYEGKNNRVRKGPHREEHKKEAGYVEEESKDNLAIRADLFLDHHLLPILHDEADFGGAAEHVIAIVSHGILLSSLWRRLLLRLGPKSVKVSPSVIASRGQVVLAHLGGWSNTGFLELSIQDLDPQASPELDIVLPAVVPSPHAIAFTADSSSRIDFDTTSPPHLVAESSEPEMPTDQLDVVGDVSVPKHAIDPESGERESPRLLEGYRTTILVVDGQQHLQGLKRQRGGIGRAEHDDKQQSMTAFFKRARKD
ncbi:phosphoglycerate mutase-like protein [Aureobasidium sp. EXF-10728]|nr:phosphoglycerate mutase-like protein [Aureobasidium sp. EXF-10728]